LDFGRWVGGDVRSQFGGRGSENGSHTQPYPKNLSSISVINQNLWHFDQSKKRRGTTFNLPETGNSGPQRFRISNQGLVSSFLGINVQSKNDTILLNQFGYIDRMALKRFQLQSPNSIPTPMDHPLPLLKANPDD
jgi:hypothetical protein